jgi:hypothetical protein
VYHQESSCIEYVVYHQASSSCIIKYRRMYIIKYRRMYFIKYRRMYIIKYRNVSSSSLMQKAKVPPRSSEVFSCNLFVSIFYPKFCCIPNRIRIMLLTEHFFSIFGPKIQSSLSLISIDKHYSNSGRSFKTLQ